LLSFQAHEQLQADALRYKAKIEDLENELNLKGQVLCLPHTHAHTHTNCTKNVPLNVPLNKDRHIDCTNFIGPNNKQASCRPLVRADLLHKAMPFAVDGGWGVAAVVSLGLGPSGCVQYGCAVVLPDPPAVAHVGLDRVPTISSP